MIPAANARNAEPQRKQERLLMMRLYAVVNGGYDAQCGLLCKEIESENPKAHHTFA